VGVLSAESQQNIEQLLLEHKTVTKTQLDDFKVQAIQAGQPLLEVIQQAGAVTEEEMVHLLAQASGLQYVNLTNIIVPPEVLGVIPKDIAQTYHAVAFGRAQGKLAVAMIDPANVQAVDFLSRKIGQSLVTYMASQGGIDKLMSQYTAEMSADLRKVVNDASENAEADQRQVQNKKVQNLVQDAPITRALNTILEYAVNSRASDIHIEPREKDLRVRFRIDGVLRETMRLPKTIEPALISRIKILSNLKIDEHRIPQDGDYTVRTPKKDVDLRIAIAPIVWGEQVVIRLLDKSNTLLTLENLGFKGRAMRVITAGIHRPHGMTLATGPTGSGKSTTLYAALQAIKDVKINIVTLEDPVEYKMEGINQIQVNPAVGLTFASGLRSILRQDPNVIMVGEIRDKETADLAVQSALTGHVVLSTIHTNSAAGVLPRLLDMQVEPFLVASTVNTVIGQRLVRKVCDKCVEERQSTPTETQSIQETLKNLMSPTTAEADKRRDDLGYETLPLSGQNAYTLFKGKGCKECSDGYKGRIGIYEVFAMSEAMELLLAKKATTNQVQDQAMADGMITMKQDGYLKALNGLTTLEEVARVASDT
jgi:type IV pilus assembly protein PilB